MKIGVVSLGCDKNRVDSEKMIARLVAAGHTVSKMLNPMVSPPLNPRLPRRL